jgi:hypothetical protein
MRLPVVRSPGGGGRDMLVIQVMMAHHKRHNTRPDGMSEVFRLSKCRSHADAIKLMDDATETIF